MINMYCHITLSILGTHSWYDISKLQCLQKHFPRPKKGRPGSQRKMRRISKVNWMVTLHAMQSLQMEKSKGVTGGLRIAKKDHRSYFLEMAWSSGLSKYVIRGITKFG